MEFKLSMVLKMYKIRVFKKFFCIVVVEICCICYNEEGWFFVWVCFVNLIMFRIYWRIGYVKNRLKYSNVCINFIVIILKKIVKSSFLVVEL